MLSVKNRESLHLAANHLFYEVSMLESAAGGLASGVAGQSTITNALLESFVIHLRNVIDFLYNDQPREDDVVAVHFFEHPKEWFDVRGEEPQKLRLARHRAHKELAHLTYTRQTVTLEQKLWRIDELLAEINPTLFKFVLEVGSLLDGTDWRTPGGYQIVHALAPPSQDPPPDRTEPPPPTT